MIFHDAKLRNTIFTETWSLSELGYSTTVQLFGRKLQEF